MKKKTGRQRLDVLLVERGLAESRQKAQAMILAGEVFVNGAPGEKPGDPAAINARIDVNSRLQKYASRAGLKLEGALADFAVQPAGRICLDAGASTGGFTDCLLQHGATKVYAVDVNTAQLAWKLRQDARVVRIERNARELEKSDIPEPPSLIAADLSFISLTKVLPALAAVADAHADFLLLVKPQFELARGDVGAGGIVRDPALHEKAIEAVRVAAEKAGLACGPVLPSRVTGAEGNQEYFLRAKKSR
jgi:23S rRNA (cytidine1920-2'-O)/16S rRNA (cytidine1409-2'-O)-methyltransferase